MNVCSNRWYSERLYSRPITDGSFFLRKILKGEKSMYQKVSTDLKFVDREKEVEKFWEENHIFEKSMENRKEGET